jgi:hydroxylamine reductase
MKGVCGKEPEVSSMIDLLVACAKGASRWAHRARELGLETREADLFVVEALFTTVTNVNFDPKRYLPFMERFKRITNDLMTRTEAAAVKVGRKFEQPFDLAFFKPAEDLASLIVQSESFAITKRKEQNGDDVTGLQETLTYGLKGMAAYADHAKILGQEDDSVYAFFHEALDFLAANPTDVNTLLGMILRCGGVNLRVMELLDAANTGIYGHPEPTKVRVTPAKGKAMLVSGHDLKDLDAILKQTEGKGINVYTHGEMLPCHSYPALKKYKHLAGNFGGAWQDQQKEFEAFPGSIVMTTNCIQKPKDSYKNRIFTTGLVAWPGVHHIADKNFASAIEMALSSEGFTADAEEKYITVGFGRNAVMGVADKVIDAVKAGNIKHFFLIGGCDGAKPGRNYYTEFAEKVPKNSVILTLACGKYRFNKLEFGDIGGIPRLLDVGQCNDAYSAIKIASALADAFECGINDLPLSLILSWYEQKAVCILLTLLHLGIKNIRLGPSLPAFVTPPVLKILVEKFNIMPTRTAEEDLRTIMG